MSRVGKFFVRNAIKVYRKSPFHPKMGPILAKFLGRLTIGRGINVHDLGRFRINIDPCQTIDTQLYYLGVFEADVVQTIEKLVQEGDVVFDVGANIGYMTLNLATCVGKTGKVVAFEPSSWAFQRLEKNIQLNDMHQVDAHRLGVGAINEKRVKAVLPCGYRNDGKDTAVEEIVDIVSLDDWVFEHGLDRLDFIKLDTDGMEAAIIKGSIEVLERFQPIIHFEFELIPENIRANAESSKHLLDTLLDLDYDFFWPETLCPFDDIYCSRLKNPVFFNEKAPYVR